MCRALTQRALPVPVQARSRQCAVQGCGKRPVFNFPGEKLPTLCQVHKQEGMVDVLNRLCTHPGTRRFQFLFWFPL